MKMMNKFKLAMLLTVLVLTGCEKAENLEASVNSRWQAIIEQDMETAYNYFSPGYKALESIEGFKLRMATAQLHIKWKEGVYKKEVCESEEMCEVTVVVVYSYTFPKKSLGAVENVPTQIKEQWIKLDDKWHHLPKKD